MTGVNMINLGDRNNVINHKRVAIATKSCLLVASA